MRKLKKKIDYNQEAFNILEEILKEYFNQFAALCQVKNNKKIQTFCDNTIRFAFKIGKTQNLIEKENLKRKMKIRVVSFLTYINNTYIKNRQSLTNFMMLLNTYDLIRNYAGVIEDSFRDNLNNEKLLKSLEILNKMNNVSINGIIDINEVILPNNIVEDFKSITKLLTSSLNKHLQYLLDFVNDNQLYNDLKTKITIKCDDLVKETKDYNIQSIKEDFSFYLAIKARLLACDFSQEEYKIETKTEEEIKKDLKYFKSNNTKINNLLKEYEKLLLEGE